MVAVMSTVVVATTLLAPRPRLDISENEEQMIHDLLRLNGAMTADEIASMLRLDEMEVSVYLANQAGLGHVSHHANRYSAWHWL
jgi:predicted transcriptional regulator